MTIKFQFDERKGTEALVYIASEWPNVTIFFASKVLFFAEKEHLNLYGRPIVADTFIAMTNGPVPTTLYDFIKGNLGQSGDPDTFRNAVELTNHPNIRAKRQVQNGVLSISDIECLDHSISFCKAKSFSALSQLTHRERSWSQTPENGAMDYELFIDTNNPNRDLIVIEAKEFAAYGVL